MILLTDLATGVESCLRLGIEPDGHYNASHADTLDSQVDLWRYSDLSSLPPKREPEDLSKEQFDQLLNWLDRNRELAGQRYELIRKRLVKIFVCNGSKDPEGLADQTINRVARKVPEIAGNYVGDPAHYFCGVAANIFRESLRRDRIPAVQHPIPQPPDERYEHAYIRLETCMEELTAQERRLVVTYYEHDRHAKIDHRRRLAEEMGMSVNALRIRACRIRANLMKCVERGPGQ